MNISFYTSCTRIHRSMLEYVFLALDLACQYQFTTILNNILDQQIVNISCVMLNLCLLCYLTWGYDFVTSFCCNSPWYSCFYGLASLLRGYNFVDHFSYSAMNIIYYFCLVHLLRCFLVHSPCAIAFH